MKKPAQKVTLGKVAVGVVIASAGLPLAVRLYRRFRCALRGRHEPKKHPLAGFRCRDCGLAGDNLADLGFKDGSHVDVLRKTFDRGPYGGFTRSEGYDAETRASEVHEAAPVEPFMRGSVMRRRA